LYFPEPPYINKVEYDDAAVSPIEMLEFAPVLTTDNLALGELVPIPTLIPLAV
jgi:hypothetical protein